MTEHVKPDLGAYVLGALSPDEAEEVRRHLAECEECAAEYRALAPLPSLLSVADGAQAATEEPLPPAFEERLLDVFARERAEARPPRRRLRFARRRLPWLAAGAAVMALVAAVLVVLPRGEEPPAPAYEVTLQGVGVAPDASATASLEPLPAGTELHLSVRNLPTGAVYEVLCEAPDWEASAGTFRVDASGRAYVVLTTAARRGEYDAIRVVRRSRGPDGEILTRDVLEARL